MTALPFRSIKSLCSLALAEDEGVGTAYEYFVKRLWLGKWLEKISSPSRVLIAGLPEKYGSGLDLLLIAQDLNAAEVVVIDDRQGALNKCRQSVEQARVLQPLKAQYIRMMNLATADELTGTFDLCLASEVLQRLKLDDRRPYIQRFAKAASALAVFVPNADNVAHESLSGLAGLSEAEVRSLIEPDAVLHACDYIDMPPWPPGMTQSNAQRERASHGLFSTVAMVILEQYARFEQFFPRRWRKRRAHIVCALCRRSTSVGARV